MPGIKRKTIQAVLAWAGSYLESYDIKTPFLDAQVLLSHCTGLDKAGLYREGGRFLIPAEEEAYRCLVLRRVKKEPVAYLTGRKEFMGLELEVNPAVLIPRPETELLVEKSLVLSARYWADQAVLIVDVGTGSGAIAISLAKYLPCARLYAVDISLSALEVARRNAVVQEVGSRITFLEGDLLFPLAGLGLEGRVNLIVANLPYIRTSDLDNLMPDVGLYEPRLALDGGPDGLCFYRCLLSQARGFLSQPGYVLMEIGEEQGRKITFELASAGWKCEIISDLAGRDRLAVAEKLIQKPG